MGGILFLPEASICIQREQVYRSLLRYHSGKIRNRGNLKISARRCNIEQQLLLSIDEVKARLLFCKENCNHFLGHGQQYHIKHLHNRLDAAKDRKYEEAEKKILDIIRREKDRGFWRRINYAMGKHKQGLLVREVEIEDGSGGRIRFKTQDSVNKSIWDEVHRKRYFLTESALTCKGRLKGDFGYLATSQSTKKVLTGTYSFSDNMDEATK